MSSNPTDTELIDWLSSVGGEIQYLRTVNKWWINWYDNKTNGSFSSGRMFDSVRDALISAYKNETD